MESQLQLELVILLIVVIVARFLYVVHSKTNGFNRKSSTALKACKTLICIGSGGHTTEMLRLISNLDFNKYSPRYYVMASNDRTSESKIIEFEKNKSQSVDFRLIRVPRSRAVHQSYISSIFTTLFAFVYSGPILLWLNPDLILCNGPGTCIPICSFAFVLKVFFMANSRIVFVESFCRTQTISLTGKILNYIADNIIVQWPTLKTKWKRSEYIGKLM